jgi:hypothetical protein
MGCEHENVNSARRKNHWSLVIQSSLLTISNKQYFLFLNFSRQRQAILAHLSHNNYCKGRPKLPRNSTICRRDVF